MRLAIGSAQFGMQYGVANTSGQVASNEIRKITNRAFLERIDTIDTAIGYGNSESILGGCVDLNKWNVVTKLPEIPSNLSQTQIQGWIFRKVNESLVRLKITRLDAILLHRPDQLFGVNGREILKGLEYAKLQGLANKIGVSVYDPQQLVNLFKIKVFDLVQLPLNIFDDRFLRSGVLIWLKENNVEVHARSIFLQGLLLLSKNERPKKFSRWLDIWDKWDVWLSDNHLTAVEACLHYVLSVKEVDRIVVGVDSVNQLDDLITAVNNNRFFSKPCLQISDDSPLINPSMWASL